MIRPREWPPIPSGVFACGRGSVAGRRAAACCIPQRLTVHRWPDEAHGICTGAAVKLTGRDSSRLRSAAPLVEAAQEHGPATLHGSPPRRLYAGRNPERAKTIEDLRAMAHRRLPGFALEYLEGGAEEEATLERNRAALAQWRFVPHAFRDVSERKSSIELFGREVLPRLG